jgi:hypothetical protein
MRSSTLLILSVEVVMGFIIACCAWAVLLGKMAMPKGKAFC